MGLGRSLLTVPRHTACLQQCGPCSLDTGLATGVNFYLDNKAVVDMFNTPTRRAMAAAHVWDKIRHWGRLWCETFKVHWQRGHPERCQPESTRWTVLEATNHVADGLTVAGCDSKGDDMRGTFELGCPWLAHVGVDRVFYRVREGASRGTGSATIGGDGGTTDTGDGDGSFAVC